MARLPIFPALLASCFSTAALADSIDINLNDESIEAVYASNWRTSDFTLGLVRNTDTHDLVASAGLLAIGEKHPPATRTDVAVGGKVYVISVGDNDIEALGLGARVRVFPGNSVIGIGGSAFYAPDVVTHDAKNFLETGVHVDFEVVKNTADIYVGYRKLRATLDDGSRVTIDSGGHVGVRISF